MKFKLFMLSGCIPTMIFAGGFQNNYQSVKGIGLGGASTALCYDASVLYVNPAAAGLLNKKLNFTLSGQMLNPYTSYLSPYNGNINMENQRLFPLQFAASYKIKKLSFGVSVNSPYQLNNKWGDNWEGRYITQQLKINTLYIQPTASFDINELIHIGAGLVYNTATVYERKAIQNTGTEDLLSETEINGSGIGYNVGIYFKINDKTRFGIDYRSAVKTDFKNGTTSFTNVPGSLNEQFPSSATASSQIKFPYTVSLGYSGEITEALMLTCDFNLTGWSTFDSLNFNLENFESLNQKSAREYVNAFAVRAGIRYTIDEKLKLRLGLAYDQTPVADNYLSPDMPDADKMVFACGISYLFSQHFEVDLGYSFENQKEREGTLASENFEGTYKTKQHILGLGINLSF